MLLFTLGSGITFPTKMGNCSLQFVSNNKDAIADLRDLITRQIRLMSGEYGTVVKRDFEVLVAASDQEFNKMTRGMAPEWSIAVAQSRRNRITLLSPAISDVGLARFRQVLIHELNHLYLHRIPNFGISPAWYIEGLAMRESGEMSLVQKVKISRARWSRKLIPLNKMNSMGALRNWEVNQAYGQSAAAVYAMLYYYGETVHREILDSMRSKAKGSVTFADLFKQVTGDDLLDFQEKYDRYIKDNYDWMFLLQTSNLVFVVLPVILVAGYYFMRRRNRKKVRLWEIEEELEDLYRDT